jgi:hypothetical protein
MKRPDLIPKPEPRRNPARAKNSQRGAGGTPEGVPLFLKGVAGKREQSQKGDPLEQHANEVADAAMAAGSQETTQETAGASVQHAVAPAGDMPMADSGSPLDSDIRRRVEPVVGADLSSLRVHQAGADRQLAGGLGARAFTHGKDVWMGPRESSSDTKLMAHEAAHVVQQGAASGPLPIQKQDDPNATTGSGTAAVTGTVGDMVTFVNNPKMEKDTSLQTELDMLSRYKPTVDVSAVDFQLMTTTPSYVGTGLFEEGRSHWDGNKPVIELTQDKYDTIAKYNAGSGDITAVHAVVRMVGHELYHLYRDKTGNKSNPLKPLFDAEVSKRMEQIRQNWLKFAQDPGGAKELGIPKGKTVTKWEDIPEAERKKIEAGAVDTPVIQGLFERTAYLVEEIYDRIEEISYLRVEQKAEAGPKRPSQGSVSEVANLVYRLSTALDQSVGSDFMTPELLAKTRTQMLDFLRRRYPHRANPSLDSYEVIFYLNAKGSGLAPVYDDNGSLISVTPPEARVP